MDFGQTTDTVELSRLNFNLPLLTSPEEKIQLERVSQAAKRSAQAQAIYVGVPVFNCQSWAGSFYPEGTESTHFLREYSKQLGSVELNSTFYSIPSAETFLKWKASVGSQFRFCPKFPKSISHSLDGKHADLNVFLERVQLLGENLGVCFLQLPQYFSIRDQDRLLSLLSVLPRELRTVIEVRNKEFFIDQRLAPAWVENFSKRHVGAVSVDTPLEREVAHVSLTAVRTMIRFLGGNLHASDFVRLRLWAKRIALWHVSGLKEVYFLIHEPNNETAPLVAKRMIQWINEELELLSSLYRIQNVEWHSFFDELID